MIKFRTMKDGTPSVATHLLEDAQSHVTCIGKLLRKYSLDELPQLWNILKGNMSFVGPRPALYNQYDLIALRTQKGIHTLMPGITGLAQISGRDELSIPQKIDYDQSYLENQTLFFDLKIILETLVWVIKGKGVSH